MNTFYTYTHSRASDKKVFYIGKGRGRRANEFTRRSAFWKNTAAKHGVVVNIVAYWPTEREAFSHEQFLILCFRDMGSPLVNLTAGGEGASGRVVSAETRAILSACFKGKPGQPRSAATRVKMAESQKRRGPRKPHTEATRSLLSEKQKGKSPGNKGISPSDETRKKQALAKIGSVASDETKAKMSASHRGKVLAQETRAKISKARKGSKLSQETKAKISQTKQNQRQALYDACYGQCRA